MNQRIKGLYFAAISNITFLQDIYKADFDVKPDHNADDLEKGAFALTYYGWLVGKYGDNWKNYI